VFRTLSFDYVGVDLDAAVTEEAYPLAWLTQTLVRMANGWPVQNIEALMPWNFTPDAVG
jgi:hypothetical protein